MNCPSCDKEVFGDACACGWLQQVKLQTPQMRSTYIQQPFGLTKEEFGLDLFSAIKASTGSRQAFATSDVYRKKKMKQKAEEYNQRGKTLLDELEILFRKGTIRQADQSRIMATL